MKLFHRIRCRCPILLLFLLHFAVGAVPPTPDFKKCGVDKSLICLVHASSCSAINRDSYYNLPGDSIKPACRRYIIIATKTVESVEIEFRDNTIAKADGVTFVSESSPIFDCRENRASSRGTSMRFYDSDSQSSTYGELYCKFEVYADPDRSKLVEVLTKYKPSEVKNDKLGARIYINSFDFNVLHFPCAWKSPFFDQNVAEPEPEEEAGMPDLSAKQDERICPVDYFNWYKPVDKKTFEMTSNFVCIKGKVMFTTKADPRRLLDADLTKGITKCTRPKCSTCSCPNCVTPPSKPAKKCTKDPHFKATDGKSCSVITCPNCKAMQIETGSGRPLVHPDNTMACGVRKKWADFESVTSVTCLEEASCTVFHPMTSSCPEKLPVDKTCNTTALNDKGNAVCAGMETWFTPKGRDDPRQVFNFSCNTTTGRWQGLSERNSSVFIGENSTVYCLKQIEEAPPAPQQGGVGTGALIGCIVGGGVVVAIIVVIVVICRKRTLKKKKKKGNCDDDEAASITGRGEKSKRIRKGSKSSTMSKTSMTSEVSAPPSE